MAEIEEVLTNKRLLQNITKSDNESPFKMKSNIVPIKKGSIDEPVIYGTRSPRPLRNGTDRKSPRTRRAAEKSLYHTIRPIDSPKYPKDSPKFKIDSPEFKMDSPNYSPKLPRSILREDDKSRKSPDLSDKVFHNKMVDDKSVYLDSPSSNSTASSLQFRRPGEQFYGTTFESFQSPEKNSKGYVPPMPRIEDDLYDDIDMLKTSSLIHRVLVNNNTPEDDVIDSPFQNDTHEHEEKIPLRNGKETLNFTFPDYNSLDRSFDCSIMTPPPPPLFDMEGYGCKCPKKLRCFLEVCLFLLIVIYFIGTPYVMIIAYQNFAESEANLRSIEIPLRNHIANSGHEIIVQASRKSKPGDGDNKSEDEDEAKKNQAVIWDGFKEYASELFKQDRHELENLNEMMNEIETRHKLISSFKRLVNDTDIIGLNPADKQCFCFAHLQDGALAVFKESIGKCSCNDPLTGKPGPQGPVGSRGPRGSDAVFNKRVLDTLKGERGLNGPKGQIGDGGPQGLTGKNGSCTETCGLEKLKISTSFTHWGRSNCNSKKNMETVYKGRIVSAQQIMEVGGTNYLCLPKEQSQDQKFTQQTEFKTYLFGVRFELGIFNLFNTSTSYLNSNIKFDAFCSVCKIHDKSSTVMIPAQTQCPAGWTREYEGYLMAQRVNTNLQRTEYICVDKTPNLKEGKDDEEKAIGYLNFVKTKCGGFCGMDDYTENQVLPCVVCSS